MKGNYNWNNYKLQKTFAGAITLKEEDGTYTPVEGKGAVTPEEKQPLDEIGSS